MSSTEHARGGAKTGFTRDPAPGVVRRQSRPSRTIRGGRRGPRSVGATPPAGLGELGRGAREQLREGVGVGTFEGRHIRAVKVSAAPRTGTPLPRAFCG